MKFLSYILTIFTLVGTNMDSNSTELPVTDPEEQRTAVTQENCENPQTPQTREATHIHKNTNTLWSKLEPAILTSLVCCGLTVCCIVGVPTLIICSSVICVVLLIMAILATTSEFYQWWQDPDKWRI